ncbi:hypothetical protein VYA_39770 [Vibrio alfacsensis]|nr:hypothetical protein VYA_39770 [Vibrio alfacsensis]
MHGSETNDDLRKLQQAVSPEMAAESVSDRVGFSSVFVMRDKFKKKFQVTPSEWRKTFRY